MDEGQAQSVMTCYGSGIKLENGGQGSEFLVKSSLFHCKILSCILLLWAVPMYFCSLKRRRSRVGIALCIDCNVFAWSSQISNGEGCGSWRARIGDPLVSRRPCGCSGGGERAAGV